MRESLRKEGYEQPLGDSDTAIRQSLGLKTNAGRIADFVGRHLSSRRWLVAESKGNDLQSAMLQLKNTAQRLWQMNPAANASNTEFRIYVNAEQFNKLQLPSSVNKMGGYALKDGYLGYTDDVLGWTFEMVEDVRVLILLAP